MRAWCLVLTAALAGCIATPDDASMAPVPDPADGGPVAWAVPCDGCYEPYIAWGGGSTLWLAANFPSALWRSTDGGQTFGAVSPPGTPDGMEGAVFVEQDIALWADGEALWWTSMVQDDVPSNTGNSVRIARSADGGATWSPNVVVRWPFEQGDLGHVSDRPWAIARDQAATVAAAQPTGFFVHLAAYQGGGQVDAQAVPLASVRSTALGRPAVDPDGRWVVPFVRNLGPYVNGHLADASLGQMQVMVGAVGSSQAEVVTVEQVAGPGAPSSPGVPAAAWDDGFVVAGVTPSGVLQLWTSPDGVTWAAGATTDGGGTVIGQPWTEASGGRIVVAWFRQSPAGVELVSWDGNDHAAGVVQASLPATQTDFPAVSLAPDGRLALAWLQDGQLHSRVLPAPVPDGPAEAA